jgi:4-hydroxybutyryl-CoA dehydratase/vinylacetyl-CoA-Delta-isomerase
MITGDEYRASLRDGRAVWLEGDRVADVPDHLVLGKSVDWVAATYDEYAGRENPMYSIPRTQQDLRAQMDFLLRSDRTAASTAGCIALATVGDERLQTYVEDLRARDLRVAAAVDDTAKPVMASRRPDGVVLDGGKQHVLGAPVVNELFVLADDVAAAVPVGAAGVRILAHSPAPREEDDRSYPYSRRRTISEGIVVFDNVYVSSDRVFESAQAYADTLQVWERARAVAEQADRAELIMGLAQTISEMNGIESVSHVRDKLSAIAVYAKMCRAGWESALANAQVGEGGMVRPDDSFLYATKAYGGHLYSEMTHYLHDVAGGSVITAPSIADLDNPETGEQLRKYMQTMTAVSGEDRVRIFHVIRDLFADTFGGWDKVTSQVVGGGIHHQRMAALESFDLGPVQARAREVAGVEVAGVRRPGV